MKWKPISSAPKDGTHVLLKPVFEMQMAYPGHWSDLYGCWYADEVGHLNGLWEPTHWMPLPPEEA